VGQKLYRIDRGIRYQHVGPLVRGILETRLILGHWDDLLRVAGSLKLGWVTASLFIAKLQSFRRQNVLTRALQEYGRLNKTIFILRYLLDEPLEGQAKSKPPPNLSESATKRLWDG
jgi:TnpA family transposase